MKKILAILLCVCLLVPSVAFGSAATVNAAGEYVLAELGYRLNYSGTYAGGNFIQSGQTFEAVDLTALGYPTAGKLASGKLGIQFDTYVNGDAVLATTFQSGYSGWIEMTSSGTCDKQEIGTAAGYLQFSYGSWRRFVVDISKFSSTSSTAFDPTAWNYLRIYFAAKNVAVGTKYEVKICNVRLVDLTKTAPSTAVDPLGDGTFEVEEPVWREMDVPDGFNNGDKIVAGYNLAEYVEAHKDVRQIQLCLEKEDYAPIIQSLADGIAAAGGGALYIPSGRYPCRTEIMLKDGVIIYGDWKNPDENPEACGTILEVYAGKGKADGTPFLTLGTNSSMVRYMTFWYPEQGFTTKTVEKYPVTVQLYQYSWAQDCTFLNSYTAVRSGPTFVLCANVQDIYGSPLFVGADINCVIDLGRFEGINFSPKYWENCGLPGSPTTDAEKTQLESYLRFNATGVTIGRIDWSYFTYVFVEGYSVGMVFNETSAGTPNGQCLNLHFKDCGVGLNVIGSHTSGEMVSNSKFENCTYGVWLTEKAQNTAGPGIVHLINCEIEATECAIYQQQGTMVQLLESTVKSGMVWVSYGWINMVNTTFETEAPQVLLEESAVSVVMVGCTTKNGGAIQVENWGYTPFINDPQKVTVPEMPTYTEEEGRKQRKEVANNTLYLVDDLANDGTTDVTAALQAKLNTVKEQGGGILYLATGDYLVNGTLVIPTGVELRGAFDMGVTGVTHGGSNIYITRATELDQPTIAMEGGSGIRGIGFHYPDQSRQNRIRAYPYAIQGRGADIYMVNINMHNVYDGIDLMTYRCDNHYIDYLGGQSLHNFVKVGAGSKNGIIRNIQQNPNGFRSDWEGIGFPETLDLIRYRQVQNRDTLVQVGHVENELIFDNLNYTGAIGIQFIAEESGKATARVVGTAMDWCTTPIEVLDCERVDILNLQMVSYLNSLSHSDLEREMNFIHFGPDNTGTVNVTGVVFWDNPDWSVNLESGTLNLYGLNYFTSKTHFAKMGKNAYMNVVAPYFKRTDLQMGEGSLENITVQAGYYYKKPVYSDELALFDNMMQRDEWWSFPIDQVQLGENDRTVFGESFTDGYNFQNMEKALTGDATATAQNGMLSLNLNTAASAGVTAVLGYMPMDNGMAKFRLEARVNIQTLSNGGSVQLMLAGSTADMITPAVFTGSELMVQDEYGDSYKLANFKTDTWYRVRVELDMRTEGQKTYKVIFLDDNENVLAESDTYPLPEDMQAKGESLVRLYVSGMDFTPEASAAAAIAVNVDYIFISYTAATPGDVDGNGKIDSTDARMTLQYFVGALDDGDLNLAAADVDGNGKVDSTDARLILQYFVGAITEFPAA